MGLAMAEKKGTRKAAEATQDEPKIEEKSQHPAERMTTTRMYVKEATKLSKLAALRGESAADSFRNVFGKLLDATLKAAAKDTIEELDETD